MAKEIRFLVPGQEEARTRGAAARAVPSGLLRGQVMQSVRVRSERAGGGSVPVTAVPGQDVVALHLANGPSLYLHPQNARDLLLAQVPGQASRGLAEADAPGLRVPAQLAWRPIERAGAAQGAPRGLGGVLLSLVEVIREPAADFAAAEVVKHVDSQVDEGVYPLAADRLETLKGARQADHIPAGNDRPVLVFIHGTFSTTKGTFEKLWAQHPQHVQQLFSHYGGRVYALEHRTLGASPVANALTLAKMLPRHTPVHLVTHSRGGLVAEVLARACATQALTDRELSLFGGAKYEDQRRDLAGLVQALKGVELSRVARVACPARGTLLASKRLDAYLSIFKWALELAGLPVAPQLVQFLAAVAQRRSDPAMIPGLAAQIPDSPLVQWLHSQTEPIPGGLRVVAGDMAGDSVSSWVKTLLSDSFYRTDNDLVVQTSSMYGGAPRKDEATFVFDQGGKVSHFNYFANETTARAVVEGLVNDTPPGFRQIGPLSWAGESQTGFRAPPRSTGPDPAKPAVFVLPGILGSNLKEGGERIWLSFRIVFGLTRLKYATGDAIEPDGPVGMVYDDLVKYLSAGHEVIEFPFDWRKPIEEEGRRLAAEVKKKLDERQATKKPVRLLAHSMGGLVARAMQLEDPALWKRMLAVEGARVLMLGTPNGGSWAPMQVLSGDDSFGNLLVGFGAPFQQKKARDLMAAMPGFLQLQAKLVESGLDKAEEWDRLRKKDEEMVLQQNFWHRDELQLDECRWGIPTQTVLDQAVALRKRFDAQLGSPEFLPGGSKVLLVVGKADFTPDGFEFDEEQGLVYLDAPQAGDGRVTLESARLPGVPAWTLDCEHGKLPEARQAFSAYVELLENGVTQALPALEAAGAARAAMPVMHVRSRRARIPVLPRPPEAPDDVLDALDRGARDAPPAGLGPVLEISVLNASLAFVRPPLLIGHYRSEQLTGTERAVDRLTGGAMQAALTVGNYPSQPGTNKVFPNRHPDAGDAQGAPGPAAVIVVGLGEEGDFRGSSLVDSVRQGVLSAAEWAARDPANLPQFELAATLIASGGPCISAGQAAQLVAQGVREANASLLQLGGKWPLVGRLQFVELYLDRAGEALRALQVQAAASPSLFRVADRLMEGPGALHRPLDAGYRGTSYDYISALSQKKDGAAGDEALIQYALDTRRARTEVRTQQPQGQLVRALVKGCTQSAVEDREIGPTLFRLLVPVDLEPYLGGTLEMVLEVDDRTAGIPWELMDSPHKGDSRPWALRAKLLRKLRVEGIPARVPDAGKDARLLIVGEPKCDQTRYPRLPGARREANSVLKCFTADGRFSAERVKALIAPEDPGTTGAAFDEITKALEAGTWRILHVCGHGDEPAEDRPSRGIVASDGIFIGPAEIEALRQVPELVFVNCCHLGAAAPSALLSYSRPEFAASVAKELVRIGVRCVVAAGWAVDDAVAEAFATTFYERLLEGDRFMDAVGAAREEAYSMGGNTWAAYQCYGDPNWTLELAVDDAQKPPPAPGPEFAGVNSAESLVLALDSLATECEFAIPGLTPKEVDAQRTRIRYLETVHGSSWGGKGAVAQAFANAWRQAGDRQSAIRWYERALGAQDGGASLKTAKQLEDLRRHPAPVTRKKASGARSARRRPARRG